MRHPCGATSLASGPAGAVPAVVRAALARHGIDQASSHQAQAAELAHAGRDVVVATGTASGKSLAYGFPRWPRWRPSRSRAFCTWRRPRRWRPTNSNPLENRWSWRAVGPAADGDTPLTERDWARAHAELGVDQPGHLHRGILPAHARWARVLRRLCYVVVDECHAPTAVSRRPGTPPAHPAGQDVRFDPVVVLASATCADPQGADSGGGGDRGGTPRPGAFVLWEPAILSAAGQDGAPVRRSAPAERAVVADLVAARCAPRLRPRPAPSRLRSRRRTTRRRGPSSPARSPLSRRPANRRELEHALGCGELMGVVSTNALELGVDIAGAGCGRARRLSGRPSPPSGRAGGRRADSGRRAVVFITRDNPRSTPTWCTIRRPCSRRWRRPSPIRRPWSAWPARRPSDTTAADLELLVDRRSSPWWRIWSPGSAGARAAPGPSPVIRRSR